MKNCLFQLNRKPIWFLICASLFAVVCAGVLNAAETVPDAWNVAPIKDGAYLESFEGQLPDWAGATGASVITNQYPTKTGSDFPQRTNAWFGAGTKVLALATEGATISNKLQNSNAGAVSFATEPVYVDMKVRFDPTDAEFDPTSLSGYKLAVFVNSEANLVAAHSGGSSTNATVLETNQWHQITLKMQNGLCDVYRNDTLVFEDITPNSSGTANVLDAVSFNGTGYVDELYVSRGDPAYAVEGATTAIPPLPVDGDNVPTAEQQTRVNKWLSDQSGLTDLGTMTQDQLSQAYLVNSIKTPTAVADDIVFGISGIDLISETSVRITARLSVDSTLKAGAINGRIQLLGKVDKGDSWSALSGAVSPDSVSFTAGEVTFTYTIPAGGYKFFKGQIIP